MYTCTQFYGDLLVRKGDGEGDTLGSLPRTRGRQKLEEINNSNFLLI